jgi:peptide/nickel transport system permease protein
LAVLRVCLVMLLAGFCGALLIRYAPGFSADQRLLDPQLSEASKAAIRAQRESRSNVLAFYGKLLHDATRGDFGESETLHQPVKELIAERVDQSARSLAIALAGAWLVGFTLAAGAFVLRWSWLAAVSEMLSSAALSAPAAVLAILALGLEAPPELAVALVVFPKVFKFSKGLLTNAYEQPCLLAARARGAGNLRLLICHALPMVKFELAALAAVTVSVTLSALLPVEVLCDLPGVGQLAWQAAEARDLQLLVVLTLLVTFVTVVCTVSADLLRPQEAQA